MVRAFLVKIMKCFPPLNEINFPNLDVSSIRYESNNLNTMSENESYSDDDFDSISRIKLKNNAIIAQKSGNNIRNRRMSLNVMNSIFRKKSGDTNKINNLVINQLKAANKTSNNLFYINKNNINNNYTINTNTIDRINSKKVMPKNISGNNLLFQPPKLIQKRENDNIKSPAEKIVLTSLKSKLKSNNSIQVIKNLTHLDKNNKSKLFDRKLKKVEKNELNAVGDKDNINKQNKSLYKETLFNRRKANICQSLKSS